MLKRLSCIVFVIGLFFSLSLSALGEEGVTDKKILLGCTTDFSGPAAAWGNQSSMGMKMRAREIQEAGGIHGRNIEFVFEDNFYDTKKAILSTNKMIYDNKVFAFVGNLGSAIGVATKPLVTEKKIPLLFPLAASDIFFQPFDRYSFNYMSPYYSQTRSVVKYFVENMGLKGKRFAMLYQDDEMGLSHFNGVKDQLKVYNAELVAAEPYKRGAVDLTSPVTRLRKAQPDVVFLGSIVTEIVKSLKVMNTIGWAPMVAGFSSAQTKYVPILAQKSGFSADGLYLCAQSPDVWADSPLKTVGDWWKRHVEWYGKEPDYATSIGYTAVRLFEVAALRAGRDLTREKLVDALETFKDEPDPIFKSVPLTYTSTDHQGAYSIYMAQFRKGNYEIISDLIDFKK